MRDLSASRISTKKNDPQLVFDEINIMQQEILRKSNITKEPEKTLPLLGYGEYVERKELQA